MNNFLIKIYGFKFFDHLIFIYPLYAVMFIDYGLNGLQIAILLAVWSITAFILEVPSGVIADKYSRKHILLFAQITRMIGYACWLFFPNFIGFLVGFILWGIKGAFTSGTFQALVFDELKQFKKDDEYTKVIGRADSLSFIAVLLASAGASISISLGYSFILIISLASLVLSCAFILSLPQVKSVESTHEKEYFTLIKEGFSTAVKNPLIFKLIMFLAAANALGGATDEYWPIFGEQVGMEKYAIAIFIGASCAVQALASYQAHRFSNFSNKFFYMIFAFNGALFLCASIIFKPAAVLLLIAFSSTFRIMTIVFDGKIQNVIPTEQRATVSSVSGLFTEIGCVSIYFGVGAISNLYTYQTSFILFSCLTILIGLAYLISSHKKTSEA